jgi:hypothetical protein
VWENDAAVFMKSINRLINSGIEESHSKPPEASTKITTSPARGPSSSPGSRLMPHKPRILREGSGIPAFTVFITANIVASTALIMLYRTFVEKLNG